MKNNVINSIIVFFFLSLVLSLIIISINFSAVSAHMPVVEDKENYIPTFGWIKNISGEVKVKTKKDGYLKLKEGQAIVGSCEIETSEAGSVSISLEDYDEHKSIFALKPNSRAAVTLSAGKSFDDTISMKWHLEPHQVKLKLEKGNLDLSIATTSVYEFSIKTPNAGVKLPRIPNIIDFNLSINEQEKTENSGRDTQIQDNIDELQKLLEEETDEDMAQIYSMTIEMSKDKLNRAIKSGLNSKGEEYNTILKVYQGKVEIKTETDLASSAYIIVGEGESYIVTGINKPLLRDED